MINTVLLNGLWQGALIAATAVVAAMLLPQRHAATRYAVWFAALIALAILPIVSVWHPAPTLVPLPPSVEGAATATSFVTVSAANATGSWLIILWLAGVGLALFRLGLSYVRISRIVRNATPAPSLGSDVTTSDEVTVPIAARFFSPVVIIPTRLVASLDPDDLSSIIRHERAHIRRWDIAGNFIQRILEACLFFNPWVYVIGQQLIKERESACDDWAVHASGEPGRYATCLAHIAQGAQRSRLPLLTPSAIGSRRMLLGRIARLLNGKATQLKINYLAVGASVAAFTVLAVLLQTSNGLASITGSPVAVATTSCVAPDYSHAPSTSAEKAKKRALFFASNTDVKVLTPAPPDIPKSALTKPRTAYALVNVGADGHPTSAKIAVSSGNAAMDHAVTEAAMASTYSPATKNCIAVAGTYMFKVQAAP